MFAFCRGLFRIAAFILVTIIVVGLHFIVVLTTGSLRMTRCWHRFLWWLFDIRVAVKGADLRPDRQVVYLSNHLSYIDIFVIGALRDLVFISKDDVAGWPVFGFLAKLQKTVFIPRTRKGMELASQRIVERMEQGYDLVLFPEGTSTDGAAVLPFKRALVPFDPAVAIQPLAIRVRDIDGAAVERQEQRDRYAWYGDMALMPHLWGLFSGRSLGVEVHFLPVLQAQDFADKAEMVQAAHQAVSAVVTGGKS